MLKLVTPELNSTDAVSVVQEIFELRWKDRLEAMEIERNNWVDADSRAEARIAELERRIANAVDSATAAQNCIKIARVDVYKVLERIKYILTAPPKEGE